MPEDDIKNALLSKKAWAVIGVALFALMAAPVCLVGLTAIQLDKAAALGDAYNTVNTLFSGLAFLGIIITVLLQSRELAAQREELRLQRMELRLQRDEMEKSRLAQEESVKALRDQAELQLKQAKCLLLSAQTAAVTAKLQGINAMNAEQFSINSSVPFKAEREHLMRDLDDLIGCTHKLNLFPVDPGPQK